MSQDEMYNLQQTDILVQRVNTISYANITLYMLLFMGFSCLTFGTSSELYSAEFIVGLFFMAWTLAMSCATSVMYIGIAARRDDYVFPCVVMSIVTAFLTTVYIFYIRKLLETVVGCLILIYILITWHSIYALYKKFLAESQTTSGQQISVETQSTNFRSDVGYSIAPSAPVEEDVRVTAPDYRPDDDCQPPTYDSIMNNPKQ